MEYYSAIKQKEEVTYVENEKALNTSCSGKEASHKSYCTIPLFVGFCVYELATVGTSPQTVGRSGQRAEECLLMGIKVYFRIMQMFSD